MREAFILALLALAAWVLLTAFNGKLERPSEVILIDEPDQGNWQ